MAETVSSDSNAKDFNGKFYYDYYKQERSNPHLKMGIVLMVGPLYLNNRLDFKTLEKISEDFEEVYLQTYDTNAGKQSEPVDLVYVFAKKLENEGNEDSKNKNRAIINNLRKAYNKYEKELRKPIKKNS